MATGPSQIAASITQLVNTKDLHENLVNVINTIDKLITDQHAANIMALWRVGELLYEIDNNSTNYLTPEQQSQHVNPSALLANAFNGMYTAENFDTARQLFESYSTEDAIAALVNMRCPTRPGWRLTASHVQMLLTVADPDQRKVLEKQCAKEAYTTKALSVELNEISGKEPREKRPTAPKGLKQRVYDLLEHQRKFISRSEKLWLEDDGLYDAIMNSPASSVTETMCGYFTEIIENFDKISELVRDHQAICQKVAQFIDAAGEATAAQDEAAGAEPDEADESDDLDQWAPKQKTQKSITR
jgi:hypothetical protein